MNNVVRLSIFLTRYLPYESVPALIFFNLTLIKTRWREIRSSAKIVDFRPFDAFILQSPDFALKPEPEASDCKPLTCLDKS
jgi:hypothetical protein